MEIDEASSISINPRAGHPSLQLPRRAPRAVEHPVRVLVTRESLRDRVPVQLAAAEAEGDVADVADAHRAVADLGGADGGLAAADAVQKVAVVVVGDVEAGGVARQGVREQPWVAG